jgi:hypothetical protein
MRAAASHSSPPCTQLGIRGIRRTHPTCVGGEDGAALLTQLLRLRHRQQHGGTGRGVPLVCERAASSTVHREVPNSIASPSRSTRPERSRSRNASHWTLWSLPSSVWYATIGCVPATLRIAPKAVRAPARPPVNCCTPTSSRSRGQVFGIVSRPQPLLSVRANENIRLPSGGGALMPREASWFRRFRSHGPGLGYATARPYQRLARRGFGHHLRDGSCRLETACYRRPRGPPGSLTNSRRLRHERALRREGVFDGTRGWGAPQHHGDL